MHLLKNKFLLLSAITITVFVSSFTTNVNTMIRTSAVQISPVTTCVDGAVNDLEFFIPETWYQSSYANRNIVLTAMKGRTQEEAWEIVVSTVLSYFDDLESDDEKSGYLRTGWVGTNSSSNTTRHRVIIKKSGNNPIKYSFKFIAQESGVNGTSINDDAKFKNVNKVPNHYDGFVEELMTKLKN